MSLRWTVTFIIFFLISLDVTAQLKVYPVKRKEVTNTKRSANARTQSTERLNLPFFDDFSFTPVDDPNDPSSNYPLDSLWMDSKSTWVSSGLGVNAPSITVVSFDGLNAEGLPYSDLALSSGLCDTLMSRPIDMSEAAVSVVERTSVWLSFQYQWQGNGEPPDQNDYIRLLFKDKDTIWVEVMQIFPKASFDRTVFYDTIIQVGNARFFHDNFQFKFENRGRKTGPFDTWNLDYIYLNKGRSATSNSFPDRAVASSISPLLGDYYTVPIKHFFDNPQLENVAFDVQSNTDATDNAIEYEARITVRDSVGNTMNESSAVLITNTGVGPNAGILLPRERVRQVVAVAPDVAMFNPAADYIEATMTVNITGDDTDPLRPSFLPVDFLRNDTVSATYVMKDFYAYDDGSAEYAAGNVRAGDRFAYAFDMLTPDPDTLAGIYAYFPEFSLMSNRVINIHIYKDNAGVPQNIPFYSIPNYTVKKMGLNQFQFIRIVEPFLVSGRFYIGFESPTVRIGLDMSHDTGDRVFEYVNTVWSQATEIRGSLMIRPMFGEGNSAGPITGIPEESIVSLYPNPNKGQFFLQGNAKLIEAYSMAGRPVTFTSEDQGDTQQISFQNPAAGFYILKIKRGNTIVTQKMVIY